MAAASTLWIPGWLAAQTFNSGSTGADGPFTPTCAPTPCTVTVALPPTGIFNFTTITIPAEVTVKFTRNAANTPVILLAQGAVTLNGTIDVSGENGGRFGHPGRGGPAGSDGGAGADGLTTGNGGFGLGPGGGSPGNGFTASGGGGGFGTGGGGGAVCTVCTPPIGVPGSGGPPYGTLLLRPILGGSGGGGGGGAPTTFPPFAGGGGGGGAGAIVIASSTSIATSSAGAVVLQANGGNAERMDGGGGAGAGGAIRLIAPTLSGHGTLLARGGQAGFFGVGGGGGGQGRIRLEAFTLSYTGGTEPLASSGLPAPVFPGTGQPTLTITRVAGIAAPASPVGSTVGFPDILLPVGTTNPVEVGLTASNIPLGTTILVTATPQSGLRTSALSSGLTATLASSTATTQLTLSLTQTSVLTASATFPLVASTGSGPIFAEGEEVKWVRVASTLGGPSTLTYITVSGKEVAAERVERGW